MYNTIMVYTYEKGGITFQKNDDGSLERINKPTNTVSVTVPSSSITKTSTTKMEQPIATEKQVLTEQIENTNETSTARQLLEYYASRGGNMFNIFRDYKIFNETLKVDQLEQLAELEQEKQDAKTDDKIFKEIGQEERDLLGTNFMEKLLGLQSEQEKQFHELFNTNVGLSMQIDELLNQQQIIDTGIGQGVTPEQINDFITTPSSEVFNSKNLLIAGGILAGIVILGKTISMRK